jgi:hypothetical protein
MAQNDTYPRHRLCCTAQREDSCAIEATQPSSLSAAMKDEQSAAIEAVESPKEESQESENEENSKNIPLKPNPRHSPTQHHHHRKQSLTSGSLRASTTAAEGNNHDLHIYRDPVLEAVAIGAAARKRHLRAQRLRQQQQHEESLVRKKKDNELTISLRRFAMAAVSTVKTLAHVSAPVLRDAKEVVVTSATEFVQDVNEEFKKGLPFSTTQTLVNENEAIFNDDEMTSLPITPRSSNSSKHLFPESFLPSIPSSGRFSAYRTRLLSLQDVSEAIDESDTTCDEVEQTIDGARSRNDTIKTGLDDPTSVESGTLKVEEQTDESYFAAAARGDVFHHQTHNDSGERKVHSVNDLSHGVNSSTAIREEIEKDESDGLVRELVEVFAQVDSNLSSVCTDIMPDLKIEQSQCGSEEFLGKEPIVFSSNRNLPNDNYIREPLTVPSDGKAEKQTEKDHASCNVVNDEDGGLLAMSHDASPDCGSAFPVHMQAGQNPKHEKVVDCTIATEFLAEHENPCYFKEKCSSNDRAIVPTGNNVAVDILQWMSQPFGGTNEKLDDSTDGNVSGTTTDYEESAVETLSTYDNVPILFAEATQAIRNFHANVQTLKECDTYQQKVTCRTICDDTYKLACTLVAEVQPDMDHLVFQTRLLSDLRRIRELQESQFAGSRGDKEDCREVHKEEEKSSIEDVYSAADSRDMPANRKGETINDTLKASLTVENEARCLSRCDSAVQGDVGAITLVEPNRREDSQVEKGHFSPVGDSRKSLDCLPRVPDNLRSTFLESSIEARVARHVQTHEESKTKESRFDRDPESIFELAGHKKTSEREEIESEDVAPHRASRAIPSLRSFEENLFMDKKKMVEGIVSMLTGFDVDVKEKSPTTGGVQSCHETVKPSVFNRLRDDGSSSTSLSTPTLANIAEIRDTVPEEALDEQLDDESFPFDFVPPKHIITDTVDKANMTVPPTKDSKYRHLVKQFSNESLGESLESLSTRQKSMCSRSVSRSPLRRRARKPRKQGGSKGSIRSPIPSFLARSPYETPVEERSLDEGRPTELTIMDHEGELVKWDSETETERPNIPDSEEMTEALDRPGLLDEALMTFSSLENVEFLLKNPLRARPNPRFRDIGTLLWRQLLANFKHNELWKAFLTKSISVTSGVEPQFEEVDDDATTTVPIAQRRFASNEILLQLHFESDSLSMPYDGFSLLTRFLSDVGPYPSQSGKATGQKDGQVYQTLRHTFPKEQQGGKPERNGGSETLPTVSDVQGEAKTHLEEVEKLLNFVVNFAAQNCADSDLGDFSFSINVKELVAIQTKAARKYGGDILAVKDVLRGQVTFPDEGSLICGLIAIYKLSRGARKHESKELPQFKIIRMKNLFRTSTSGRELCESLPTGYRHILLNIRLENGLIAGTSFLTIDWCVSLTIRNSHYTFVF